MMSFLTYITTFFMNFEILPILTEYAKLNKGEMKFKKIFSSETTETISTKLCWIDSWVVLFQNCVRHFRTPTKMAAKLKIEKRGDEILIVHCCFSVSQNELKF